MQPPQPPEQTMGGDVLYARCTALCVEVMGKIGSEDILLVPTETCSAKFRTKSTVKCHLMLAARAVGFTLFLSASSLQILALG